MCGYVCRGDYYKRYNIFQQHLQTKCTSCLYISYVNSLLPGNYLGFYNVDNISVVKMVQFVKISVEKSGISPLRRTDNSFHCFIVSPDL